ncbi:MAG TPA: GNAT family N-acetyltransferase [Cytophagaceae bacterium]|jgi:GNAT superfamily N-acetyltransferase
MEGIRYRTADSGDDDIVRKLMHNFYSNDQKENSIPDKKITDTLRHLRGCPSAGSILLIEKGVEGIGYSLLINFWSNEYGGNMLIIDELYIRPEYRNVGVGSKFLSYLKESGYNNAVALELEVLPNNFKALEWYKKLGFQTSDRTFMTMIL